jgi:hypothetical protein
MVTLSLSSLPLLLRLTALKLRGWSLHGRKEEEERERVRERERENKEDREAPIT